MSDFGDVRSLLHEARPTQTTFEAVVQAFKDADDPDEAERVWLPYAVAQMEAWPEVVRRVYLDGQAALGPGSWGWLALAKRVEFAGSWWSRDVLRERMGVRGGGALRRPRHARPARQPSR